MFISVFCNKDHYHASTLSTESIIQHALQFYIIVGQCMHDNPNYGKDLERDIHGIAWPAPELKPITSLYTMQILPKRSHATIVG